VQHALQALANSAVELLQRRFPSDGGNVIKLLLRENCMRSERSGAPNDLLDVSNVCGKAGSTAEAFDEPRGYNLTSLSSAPRRFATI